MNNRELEMYCDDEAQQKKWLHALNQTYHRNWNECLYFLYYFFYPYLNFHNSLSELAGIVASAQ